MSQSEKWCPVTTARAVLLGWNLKSSSEHPGCVGRGHQGAAEVSAHPFAVEITGVQETTPRDHRSSVAWRVEMTWSRVRASWGPAELCPSLTKHQVVGDSGNVS